MYTIPANRAESLEHPLTILRSLPLSISSALWSMEVSSKTLDLYSALAILVLCGVDMQSAALEPNYRIQLRERGIERRAATLEANRDRPRSILMTMFTTVAGMLPLWLGSGLGAEQRRAVAAVVIGGQSLALILPLTLTPVV
jgi:HAE1 family hydrophobic/amphiphilic exporter-1